MSFAMRRKSKIVIPGLTSYASGSGETNELQQFLSLQTARVTTKQIELPPVVTWKVSPPYVLSKTVLGMHEKAQKFFVKVGKYKVRITCDGKVDVEVNALDRINNIHYPPTAIQGTKEGSLLFVPLAPVPFDSLCVEMQIIVRAADPKAAPIIDVLPDCETFHNSGYVDVLKDTKGGVFDLEPGCYQIAVGSAEKEKQEHACDFEYELVGVKKIEMKAISNLWISQRIVVYNDERRLPITCHMKHHVSNKPQIATLGISTVSITNAAESSAKEQKSHFQYIIFKVLDQDALKSAEEKDKTALLTHLQKRLEISVVNRDVKELESIANIATVSGFNEVLTTSQACLKVFDTQHKIIDRIYELITSSTQTHAKKGDTTKEREDLEIQITRSKSEIEKVKNTSFPRLDKAVRRALKHVSFLKEIEKAKSECKKVVVKQAAALETVVEDSEIQNLKAEREQVLEAANKFQIESAYTKFLKLWNEFVDMYFTKGITEEQLESHIQRWRQINSREPTPDIEYITQIETVGATAANWDPVKMVAHHVLRLCENKAREAQQVKKAASEFVHFITEDNIELLRHYLFVQKDFLAKEQRLRAEKIEKAMEKKEDYMALLTPEEKQVFAAKREFENVITELNVEMLTKFLSENAKILHSTYIDRGNQIAAKLVAGEDATTVFTPKEADMFKKKRASPHDKKFPVNFKFGGKLSVPAIVINKGEPLEGKLIQVRQLIFEGYVKPNMQKTPVPDLLNELHPASEISKIIRKQVIPLFFAIFTHGWNDKDNLIWDLIEQLAVKNAEVKKGVDAINSQITKEKLSHNHVIHWKVTKFRAFLCFMINQKKLKTFVETFLTNTAIVSKYYAEDAPIIKSKLKTILPQEAAGFYDVAAFKLDESLPRNEYAPN